MLREARAAVLAQPALVGAPLRQALTETADTWLRSLLEDVVGDREGIALVAVGGYGRRDPAAGSDLDLVLLHDERVDVAAVADTVWYPIWDAGVGLDHAVRTIDQAVAVAREDLKAALGLLDARHVAGDAGLTARLREQVFARWRRDARVRLPELVNAVRDRAARAGELAFLLEPDLKECRGGVRDVHAMHAIAAAWVADGPDERVRAAHELLLDVRGELHRRSARGSDLLVQQEHGPVAAALGWPDPDALMRAVYGAARTISFATDEACRRASAATAPPRRWGRRQGPVRRPLADGVVEQDGEVHLARDADPSGDPLLVLRVAAAAAQADLPIAGHTLQRLAAKAPPLPDPWPDAARDALLATLGAGPPAVAVVEALDQAGLMQRLVPEWAEVRCKPQHNPVHRFTVDRHLVEAAVAATQFTRRVSRPDLLLLGALLHDMGKGFPGDHTDAGVAVVPVIARRLGLPAADVSRLTALVRHHLLLPDTATRRDLDDPATVEAVARAVGDLDTLELLHALTEADAAATGPAAWGEWKAGLVARLVRLVGAALTGTPAPEPELVDAGALALAAAGRLSVDIAGSRVTVVAPDRAGLLWRWAAVLAVHRLAIHAARATSVAAESAAMAVTTFDVTPRFGSLPDLDSLRSDIRRAHDDPADLLAKLAARERAYAPQHPSAAPKVLWVEGASRTASVVEVRAHDVVGLLYRLTRALADEGLDVRSAQVHTMGAEVVDTFYVVDAGGARLDDVARRDAVAARLLAACEPALPSGSAERDLH